jgi:hypothetical protein
LKTLALIASVLALVVLIREFVEQYGALIFLVRVAAMLTDPPFVIGALIVGVSAGFAKRELVGLAGGVALACAITGYVAFRSPIPAARDPVVFGELVLMRTWAVMVLVVLFGLVARLRRQTFTAPE